MALTSLLKDFITRSGMAVEGSTAVSTSTYVNGLQTGTFQVAGGVAVGKNIIVGSTATFYGITYHNNQLVVNSSATVATTLYVTGISTLNGVVVPSGSTLLASGGQVATGAANGTGALQVTGGAGVSGNLYVGGTTYLTGDLYVDGTQFVINSQSLNAGEKALVLSTGSTSAIVATGAGVYIGASSGTAYTSFTYDGVNSWIIPNSATSGNLKVQGLVGTNGTATGALQVAGGVGIGGGLFVGSVITATNINAVLGTASNAGTIYGGTTGALVYQSAPSTTAFLTAGGNGNVLQLTGGIPTWSPLSGISAGLATTATNIAGGVKDQIPFQNAPGNTVFSGGLLFNGTTFTATNVSIPGLTNSTSTNTGALTVAGGVGIGADLYVGGNIKVDGQVIFTGIGADKVSSTTGTFVNVAVTGTGVAMTVPNGSVTIGANLTATTIVVTSTNASTLTNALNALYVQGGVAIDKTLTVSGSTYLQNLTVSGYITGTNVTINGITGTNAQFYGDATGNGALYAGVLGYTPFTQTIFQATGNFNGYMETNVQNINAGTKASTDIVASADNVTTSSAYIDMGITGSAWDGSQLYSLGTALGPNDGYVMVGQNASTADHRGDLVFGTTTDQSQIKFIVAATATQVTTSSVAIIMNPVGTNAVSTLTGTLVVGGGVGIGGSLVVGNNVTATSAILTSTAPTNSGSTGALTVAGGLGVAGGAFIGATLTATSVVVTGVLSAATVNLSGNIQVVALTATTITVTGNETISGSLAVTGNAQAAIVTATTVNVTGNETVGGSLTVTSMSALNGGATTTVLTATTVNITGNETVGGSLVVTGNVQGSTITATNLTVTGNATIAGLTLSNPVSFVTLTATNLTVLGTAVVNNLNVTGTSITFTGVSTFTNITNVTNPTNATNTTTGAFQVVGGVGVGRDVQVGGAVYAGVNTAGLTATTVVGLVSNAFQESSYISQVLGSGQNGIEQYLDTMSTSTYRSAEYTVQITDFPKVHIGKLLLMHDGTNNIYLTEFGVVTNSGTLGTFDAAFTGTNVVLKFTPTSAPTAMTIKVRRTAITI